MLRRPSILRWIFANVMDSVFNILPGIQEDLPARSGPYWVIHGSATSSNHCVLAILLKVGDHLFGVIAMAANHEVNMIGHNRAGIAGVAVATNGLSEATPNEEDFHIGKKESLVFQEVVSLLIEIPQSMGRWLNLFSPKVNIPQRSQFVEPEVVRGTATWIIGQPAAIGGPDEMKSGDHVDAAHCAAGAKRQAKLCLRFAPA
jgi:hypothetical protein